MSLMLNFRVSSPKLARLFFLKSLQSERRYDAFELSGTSYQTRQRHTPGAIAKAPDLTIKRDF